MYISWLLCLPSSQQICTALPWLPPLPLLEARRAPGVSLHSAPGPRPVPGGAPQTSPWGPHPRPHSPEATLTPWFSSPSRVSTTEVSLHHNNFLEGLDGTKPSGVAVKRHGNEEREICCVPTVLSTGNIPYRAPLHTQPPSQKQLAGFFWIPWLCLHYIYISYQGPGTQ